MLHSYERCLRFKALRTKKKKYCRMVDLIKGQRGKGGEKKGRKIENVLYTGFRSRKNSSIKKDL